MKIIAALLLTTLAFAAGPEDGPRALAAGNNDFGANLLKVYAGDKGNKVVSPYSASQALLMLANGTKGETQNLLVDTVVGEKLTMVDINSYNRVTMMALNQTDDVTLQVANSVWVNDKFQVHNDFINSLRLNFGARAERLDMTKANEAAATISKWVEQRTTDPKDPKAEPRIKDIVKPTDLSNVELLLVNALYFKGAWTTPFEEFNTKPENFQNSERQTKKVLTMKVMDTFKYHGQQVRGEGGTPRGYEAIELPFGKGGASLVVIVPAMDNLEVLEETLRQPGALNGVLTRLAAQVPVQGNVELPKFKLESTIDLKPVLEELGLSSLFTTESDLSPINPDPRLKVTKAIQKTFIDVNEKGVEAAAATAISVGIESAQINRPQFTFKANRPFVVVLKENKYNNVLFIGSIGSL